MGKLKGNLTIEEMKKKPGGNVQWPPQYTHGISKNPHTSADQLRKQQEIVGKVRAFDRHSNMDNQPGPTQRRQRTKWG
jgi:hypothetical protein